MAIFTVHKRADAPLDDVHFVKEGFSLWAMVFTCVWALCRGLWVVAALSFALLVGLVSVAELPGFQALALAQPLVCLLFGFEASTLERFELHRRGYVEIATVSADTREAAELAYFTQHKPSSQTLMETPSPLRYLPPSSPLGLFGNV